MIDAAHWVIIAMAVGSAAQPAQPNAPATLTRLDGQSLVGALQAIDAAEATFEVEGDAVHIPLDELAKIEFMAPPARSPAEYSERF